MAEKEKKIETAKPKLAKEKKRGGLKKKFKDYRSEMSKVVWLSPKDTARQTGVVLIILVISIAALGAMDYLFNFLIQLI